MIITVIVAAVICLIQTLLLIAFSKEKKTVSTVDPLTRLGNKGGFDKSLASAIKSGDDFYLFYCDLDNFKQLNDTMGHDAGDELLKLVAKIWSDINICEHEVFRQGGDEFSVLAKCSKKKAEELARTMIAELDKKKPKDQIYITSSIGIANFPNDADNADDLKKYADTTMYEAKNSGKNQYKFFTHDIYNKITNEYNLEKLAMEIAGNNDFNMVYQPQWDTKTHKLVGFESLIRTRNADTQNFILAAESNGTIFDIDLNIFKRVLKDTKEIVVKNPSIIISINVSGKHISLPNFYTQIYDIMNELEYPSTNIKFEITETSAVKNISQSANKIKKLKRLGIKIALDDFGVAYSNLRYLIDMNIDSLKIDKSFIDMMNKDSRFVEFIINLGHMIGCEVIAEGVETETQLAMLRLFKCDYIQGFIWGKPLSLEDAKKLIEEKL